MVDITLQYKIVIDYTSRDLGNVAARGLIIRVGKNRGIYLTSVESTCHRHVTTCHHWVGHEAYAVMKGRHGQVTPSWQVRWTEGRMWGRLESHCDTMLTV